MSSVSKTTALLVIPLLAGCFQYVPVTPDRVSPGVPVRIQLTDDGARTVTEQAGRPLSAIEGTLLRADASSWIVSAPLPDNPKAYLDRDLETRVTIPLDAVAGVATRRLDKVRSTLVGAVVAAAVGAAVLLIFEGDPGGKAAPPPGPTPPGEGSVIPVGGAHSPR